MTQPNETHAFTLDALLNRRVVLDTQGPLVYIGRLAARDQHGYWLTEADVHDRTDGHSTKEVYISQAHELERTGNRNVNRRRVFVDCRAVVSISALDDVVSEQPLGEDEAWTP